MSPAIIRITKEAILEAGLALLRDQGPDALNARALAARLKCSTQPIFSNFPSMDALRLSLVQEAEKVYQAFIAQEMEKNLYPPYKASGMAYIRFAREESQLFRLLYMRSRKDEPAPPEDQLTQKMIRLIQNGTGADQNQAELMHLEMWAFVHGMAVLCATQFYPLDEELTSRMLTDAFQGLKARHNL